MYVSVFDKHFYSLNYVQRINVQYSSPRCISSDLKGVGIYHSNLEECKILDGIRTLAIIVDVSVNFPSIQEKPFFL